MNWQEINTSLGVTGAVGLIVVRNQQCHSMKGASRKFSSLAQDILFRTISSSCRQEIILVMPSPQCFPIQIILWKANLKNQNSMVMRSRSFHIQLFPRFLKQKMHWKLFITAMILMQAPSHSCKRYQTYPSSYRVLIISVSLHTLQNIASVASKGVYSVLILDAASE